MRSNMESNCWNIPIDANSSKIRPNGPPSVALRSTSAKTAFNCSANQGEALRAAVSSSCLRASWAEETCRSTVPNSAINTRQHGNSEQAA